MSKSLNKPRTLVRGLFEHPKVQNKPRLLSRGKTEGLCDFIKNLSKKVLEDVLKDNDEPYEIWVNNPEKAFFVRGYSEGEQWLSA